MKRTIGNFDRFFVTEKETTGPFVKRVAVLVPFRDRKLRRPSQRRSGSGIAVIVAVVFFMMMPRGADGNLVRNAWIVFAFVAVGIGGHQNSHVYS